MRVTIHYVFTIVLHYVGIAVVLLILALLIGTGPVTRSTGIALSWIAAPGAILWVATGPRCPSRAQGVLLTSVLSSSGSWCVLRSTGHGPLASLGGTAARGPQTLTQEHTMTNHTDISTLKQRIAQLEAAGLPELDERIAALTLELANCRELAKAIRFYETEVVSYNEYRDQVENMLKHDVW